MDPYINLVDLFNNPKLGRNLSFNIIPTSFNLYNPSGKASSHYSYT
jgi:hypothetical protein